jgi:hypothetical protein
VSPTGLNKSKKVFQPDGDGRDHPELDESEMMNDDGHRKFQMLMGILVWVVTIGHIDVALVKDTRIEHSEYSAISRSDVTDEWWSIQGNPFTEEARTG